LKIALSRETMPIKILDVGCGCGDQSLHLLKTLSHQTTKPQAPNSDQNIRHRSIKQKPQSLPALTSYIGITLEPAQADLAERRIKQSENASIPAKVFCADASLPTNWPAELSSLTESASTDSQSESTWLLALDTMYHFRPSRIPLLTHAVNLKASFMAFDLLLGDNVRWWEKLILRIVCLGTNAPFGNFVTENQYLDMLVGVGYAREEIEVRDVSRFVFGGLAGFIEERVRVGRDYGLSLGKYKVARWVFAWWATRGVVRGAVVVARR
jgi:hypothetical protein